MNRLRSPEPTGSGRGDARRGRVRRRAGGYATDMNATLLWIIAAILVIAGIVQIVQGQLLFGGLLIAGGFLVGPGGYSIAR